MNGVDLPVFHPCSPETASIAHLFLHVLIVCSFILLIVIGMVLPIRRHILAIEDWS